MASRPRGSLAGIVFRRLGGEPERRQAARLLPDCPLDDHDSTCEWYGLCDLTATTTSGLAGVAVFRRVDSTTARLCGLAVSAAYGDPSLGRRLVCEVADRLRASGVEQLIAPPTLGPWAAALLAQVGLVPQQQAQRSGSEWSLLPL